MVSNVSGMGSAKNVNKKEEELKKQREARAKGEIIIERGMTVSELAKKFKMSVDDFKKMTGLKSSALTVGNSLKGIPTDTVQGGKGLASLAKKHGMTLKEFCNLNGIHENYKPQKGEAFYVFPKQDTAAAQKPKTPTTEASTPKPSAQPVPQAANPSAPAVSSEQKTLTADEIVEKLEKAADDNRGAVGKPDFDNVFNQITPELAIDVVTKFQEKYGKSLIKMISEEWSSSKDARKEAMTKIYDLVAQAKGDTNTERKNAFINELNDQFDSFGRVSTKKTDIYIDEIIHPADHIVEKLEKAADDNRGAVGKPDFDNVFNQITPELAIDVVTKFQEKYGKSLINMISDEWSSSKDARKEAMTKIYDLVAQAKGINNPQNRKEFIDILNEEFNSFGRVSTKKMDEIINRMINPSTDNSTQAESTSSTARPATQRTDNTGSNASHLSGKAYPNEIYYSTNGGTSKDITPTTMTSIKDSSGNTVNAGTLKNWAISGGKRDKAFKDVQDPFIQRPLPNYNTETRKIEAVTEVQTPTASGNLDGKVVVLNPGHGGYQQKNGYFDAGTVLSVKNAEGKNMPIEEWRVAQSYVENMADNLRARGATVVIVSGAVRNGGMAEQEYLEHMFNGEKGCDEVRDLMRNTNKSDMVMLSVHVESAKEKPNDKKCTVRYTKDIDKELSDNINRYVQQGFISLTPASTHDNLYVNRAARGITSSLLEIGNIANGNITNSLLSRADQKKYAECIANAIEETLLH